MNNPASQNDKVRNIRKSLLDELDTNKIFVGWKDKKAKAVEMIIEGDQTINREKFDSIVGDMLPHGLFDYQTYPQDGTVSWAETHIIFHV